jgi:hypothetical protein
MNTLIPITIFTLLQLADAYTTHRLLSNGGRELNPILAKLFDKFGYKGPLVIVKVLCIAGGVWLHLSQQWEILTVLCVIYAVVVGRNVRQMRK